MQVIAMLEAIKGYGQASVWAALVLDGEELIAAERSNWLHVVWLSQQQDQLVLDILTCQFAIPLHQWQLILWQSKP